ncbi:glycosyltransferase family 4 protein [Candidatus Falkowbacteria bacterium]|nr:glycosyltransferase family 4 protein [Candidatus Falkowbacteria bacterium]
MKILSIGTDKSALNINSETAKRAIEYGALVEKITIIVPNSVCSEVDLSVNVKAISAGGGGKFFQFFSILFFLFKLAKKEKFDLITVQDPYYLALLGLILRWRFGIGLHIQLHGWEKFEGLRAATAKFVLPRANAVRTVSQRLKKQLINEFKVKEEKITVAPIFVERITRNVERAIRNNDKFIFLTVGRLAPVKNISLQIEAMAEVTNNLQLTTSNIKVELWIVGEGKERKKLELKIKNLRLGNNVKLLGQKNREELCDIYSKADAFLLTSDYEGWGLVVIEAASFGLPIIMTDVGCAGEVIKDPLTSSGQASGIIIPVGDKEKLIAAMVEIINNKELRKKIGEGARRAISRLPSKEEMLRLYKKSWEKATSRNT